MVESRRYDANSSLYSYPSRRPDSVGFGELDTVAEHRQRPAQRLRLAFFESSREPPPSSLPQPVAEPPPGIETNARTRAAWLPWLISSVSVVASGCSERSQTWRHLTLR